MSHFVMWALVLEMLLVGTPTTVREEIVVGEDTNNGMEQWDTNNGEELWGHQQRGTRGTPTTGEKDL